MTRVLLAVLLLTACDVQGGTSDAGSCMGELPSSCNTIPSYSMTIVPLLQVNCIACHGTDEATSYSPLTTYAEVASQRASIITQTDACLMPPPGSPDAGVFTDGDRSTLLAWLACGAPMN